MPRVSVLMTCYNRSGYLAAAIESVLAQTFSDFEFLVVDDASTDGSVEIAQQYAQRDPRIRVVVNDRNLGDYPNRNFAASLATGEYIRYADSDDIQYPHCLATIVPLLDAHPTAMVALGAARAWPGGPVPMLLTPRESYAREFLGTGLFSIGPGGALFRRAALQEFGGFPIDPGIGSATDYVFWFRFLAKHPAVLVPGDLYWYRTHSGQELNSASHAANYARAASHAWRALNDPDCPLAGPEAERARKNFGGRIAISVARDLRAGNVALAALRARNSGMSWAEWLKYVRRPRRDPRADMIIDDAGNPVVPEWARAPHR